MIALYIALGLLAAFLLTIMVRALLFVPPRPATAAAGEMEIDHMRLTASLQAMIRIPTISYAEEGRADQKQFDRFVGLLRTLPQGLCPGWFSQAGQNALLRISRSIPASPPSSWPLDVCG